MEVLFDKLLAEANLTLSMEQKKKQICYVNLLQQWNQVYNLTAVRQPEKVLSQHLMDSLSALPFLEGDQILDVGSGAGLPGIPLAIAEPARQFTLLDSLGKRTQFLTEVKQQLQLENISIVQDRVEKFQSKRLFNSIISRAFSSLSELLILCEHLLEPGGQFIAMKGRLFPEELAKVQKPFVNIKTIPLQVPGLLHKDRHLVIITSLAKS